MPLARHVARKVWTQIGHSQALEELEDALAFGGPFVFEVALDEKLIGADVTWQLHTLQRIPPDLIVGLTVFKKDIRIDNAELRKLVFQANADGSVDGFAGKVEEHRWPAS